MIEVAVQRTFPEIRRMRPKLPASEPTAFWFRVVDRYRTVAREQDIADEN